MRSISGSYSASSKQLGLSGTVSVSLEGFTFMASLAPGPNGAPGVVIDTQTGQAVFKNLEISVTGFNLGLFEIENFDMTFNVEVPGDYEITDNITIDVPGGWGVSASVDFSYDQNGGGFSFHEIALAFTVDIPIPDTSINITTLGRSRKHRRTELVDQRHRPTFGDPVTFLMLQCVGGRGQFTLDRSKLVLNGQVAFGGTASSSSPPQLSSFFGIVTGSTFDWAANTCSLQINGSFADGTTSQ